MSENLRWYNSVEAAGKRLFVAVDNADSVRTSGVKFAERARGYYTGEDAQYIAYVSLEAAQKAWPLAKIAEFHLDASIMARTARLVPSYYKDDAREAWLPVELKYEIRGDLPSAALVAVHESTNEDLRRAMKSAGPAPLSDEGLLVINNIDTAARAVKAAMNVLESLRGKIVRAPDMDSRKKFYASISGLENWGGGGHGSGVMDKFVSNAKQRDALLARARDSIKVIRECLRAAERPNTAAYVRQVMSRVDEAEKELFPAKNATDMDTAHRVNSASERLDLTIETIKDMREMAAGTYGDKGLRQAVNEELEDWKERNGLIAPRPKTQDEWRAQRRESLEKSPGINRNFV